MQITNSSGAPVQQGVSQPAVVPPAVGNPQTQALIQNNSQIAAAAPTYPVAMMSPAYLMAYVQMPVAIGGFTAAMPGASFAPNAATGATAGMAGMPASAADNPNGASHVTANPTNSTASAAMPSMAGYGGYGGVGGYAGYAMPMMMMAPVFLQMGYPMVFQGSVAQPPAAVAEPEEVAVPSSPQPATPDIQTDAVPDAPVVTDSPVIDVVPQSDPDQPSSSLPSLPISSLQADDFADYKLIEKSKQTETNLSFSLTTKEGDQITLNFSQIDATSTMRFNGETLEGGTMKDSSFTEESERIVNMDVVGDLSEDEKAAIDKVMATVIEAVNAFFTGKTGDAVAKLKAMDFDGAQLAELSLNMSLSKSASVSKAYHDGVDYLHDLKNRDADIGQALEFMATEQKRMIDMAKDLLDAPSAAKLIRSLVPPMMSEPFAQLAEQIAQPVVEDTADENMLDKDTAES
ncbi:MAG: hypothetical protein NXH95_01525 [Pseudomonadaceae bacterium]|nr:hypothetical protein [Pseudomonadaceae bacterium]